MAYSRSQIEAIAQKVREKYGNTNEKQINVVEIANKLGFDVYEADFENDRIAGKVIDDGNTRAIYINRHDIPQRKRFTVAHEIGHIVLHHPLSNERFEKIDYRGANEKYDQKEWEANQFAASLLMPEDITRKLWEKLQDVDDFADVMGVSKAAAAIRLESLELI